MVKLILGAMFAVIATGILLYFWNDKPKPIIEPSKAAVALAKRAQASVNQKAWQKTGVVGWTFADRRSHLWDRKRGFVQVKLRDKVHLLRLSDKTGLVFDGDGKQVKGRAATEAIHVAWEAFINDAFWLNPLDTLFHPGVKLGLTPEGADEPGLLVSYSKGGATPGDTYLLMFDEQDRLLAWRMWVSIIPVGGLKLTFEDWTQLATGAWVSTRHEGLLDLELTKLFAAESMEEAGTPADPFAPLEKHSAELGNVTTDPASRPSRPSVTSTSS